MMELRAAMALATAASMSAVRAVRSAAGMEPLAMAFAVCRSDWMALPWVRSARGQIAGIHW